MRPAENYMDYVVRVEQLGSIPLAVVRRRGSLAQLPQIVPEACGVVWKLVKAQGIAGAGRHVAVYLDEQINLEVGVELANPAAVSGELVSSSTPAGMVAMTTHFGPYQLLGNAHRAIRDWCAAGGHAMAGPNWEFYGHWIDEWNRDPSKIRTDIYYLLSEKS
jgi:effector-binding domain-containing protein